MRKIVMMLLLFIIGLQCGAENIYDELDRLIEQRKMFTEKKEAHIDSVRRQLDNPALTDKARYKICMQLYDEYDVFSFDSAIVYAHKSVTYAKRVNEKKWITNALLKVAHVYTLAGMFSESNNILKSIKYEELDSRFQISYIEESYLHMELMAEFAADTHLYPVYLEKARKLRRKLLLSPHRKAHSYIMALAYELGEKGKTQEAITMLKHYLSGFRPNQHHYAIVTNALASLCRRAGRHDLQHKYLIESAKADIRASVKENTSLRSLAYLLFDDGDIERAYKYLTIAIEDANFYGTRLRNSQDSRLIPQIITVHTAHQHAQRSKVMILLGIVSIVAFSLLCTSFAAARYLKRFQERNKEVVKLNKKLHDAVENLSKINSEFKEANAIKEEYLGRFLELSSNLIDKTDKQRLQSVRLAREKRLDELCNKLKSASFIQTVTQEYYQNFDDAFLNIYPNFVDKVNRLLRSDARIEPKEAKRLTTELRILALIRLGLTDNARIAAILRSGITTVYTYRSKLKARALDHDNFESKIKKIGN